MLTPPRYGPSCESVNSQCEISQLSLHGCAKTSNSRPLSSTRVACVFNRVMSRFGRPGYARLLVSVRNSHGGQLPYNPQRYILSGPVARARTPYDPHQIVTLSSS